MTDADINNQGFSKFETMLLREMSSLRDDMKANASRNDSDHTAIRSDIVTMKVTEGQLKVKSSMYGSFAGILVSMFTHLLNLVLKK